MKKYALIQSGIDTDWLSLPLRNAFDHKHSLYIEGGTLIYVMGLMHHTMVVMGL